MPDQGLPVTMARMPALSRPCESAVLERDGAPRVRLDPLPDRWIRPCPLAASPRTDRATVSAILDVARSHPDLARELCQWELGGATIPETPILRRLSMVAPLLTERVADVDATNTLAALAAARRPAPATPLADVLGIPAADVRRALARARDMGLVRSSGELSTFTHPLVRAVAIALVGPDRMSALHAAFARLLERMTGERMTGELGPAVIDMAEHRFAAGESGSAVLESCLRADEWSWGTGDLTGTATWAERGLTMLPDERTKARLLHLHGLCALRSRAVATGIRNLTTAVEISERSDDGAAYAAVTADLLQARSLARVFDPDTVPLVRRALWRCPVTRSDLRTRLVSHLAEAASWQDPARHRRLAHAAVELARSAGDPEAVAFALLVGQLAPSPGPATAGTEDLAELARVSATARTAARLARAHAALVNGNRSMVDELSRPDPALRPDPSSSSHAEWAAAGTTYMVVAGALLDCDGARFSTAVRLLAGIAPQWAEVASLVGTSMWPDLVGPTDPRAWRSPAERQSPSWLTALRDAVLAVGRATHPVVRVDELAEVAAHLPRPGDLLPDIAWSTWLALIAHVGALAGDHDLCAEAAEALQPHAATFVVLGIGTPIGPAGWFLADALLSIGRTEEAIAANREATQISARLRSRPWARRCRIQRLRLLRSGERAFSLPSDPAGPVPPARRGDQHRPDAASNDADVQESKDAREGLAALHDDDMRLLGWVGHGMTNQAIARRLAVSVSTVERRLSSIYRILGVSGRTQAASLLATITS